MHPNIAVGLDGAAITTSTLGRLARLRPAASKPAVGPLWERLIHSLGGAFGSLPSTLWFAVDAAIFWLGLYIAYNVFPPPELLDTPHISLARAVAIFSFVVGAAGLVFGLQERETLMSRSRILTRMLLTTLTVAMTSYAIIYVLMYATVSRRAVGLSLATFLVAGTGIRLCAWWAIHRIRRGIVIVGSRTLYESFVDAQTQGCLPEYNLIGYASAKDRVSNEEPDSDYLGAIDEQLERFDRGVTDIVLGKEASNDHRVMDWVVAALQRGCRVTNEATFYEKATGQILVDEITPTWFLLADLKVHCAQQAKLKRLIDIATSVIGLALTLPLWPLIALAIKLGDRGPVFYSQNRMGQNGQIFKLYKFRSMATNAENGKSIWASPNDPRVTGVGRFLRKTRMDELPQFFNVLIGQMSIIGPRPERPDIVQSLCEHLPYYAERHLVKPGITGWAQISFRYGSTVEDAKRKLQFDLYYLKHMSFELDVMILFRTIGTFLRGAC